MVVWVSASTEEKEVIASTTVVVFQLVPRLLRACRGISPWWCILSLESIQCFLNKRMDGRSKQSSGYYGKARVKPQGAWYKETRVSNQITLLQCNIQYISPSVHQFYWALPSRKVTINRRRIKKDKDARTLSGLAHQSKLGLVIEWKLLPKKWVKFNDEYTYKGLTCDL